MDDIKETISSIRDAQLTLDKVLAAGELTKGKDGVLEDKTQSMSRTNLWNNGASVGFSILKKKGVTFPKHIHESVQYLICLKGLCSVSIGGSIRILESGGCCAIPPRVVHSVMAMEENTEIIDVVVPKEKAYSK